MVILLKKQLKNILKIQKTKFDLNLQSKVRDGVDEIFGLDASTYSVVPSDPSIVKVNSEIGQLL